MRAESFEELFELHFDAIYGYLARRVGPDLAGDLASELGRLCEGEIGRVVAGLRQGAKIGAGGGHQAR